MINSRKLGNDYEDMACKYLESKGYFIIERNFRVKQGEIDIVARDGKTIVFVEVKYRKDEKSGNPLEAVTYNKQKTISKVSLFYMYKNKINPENTPIRYDVIGIIKEDIKHIENAFYYVR